MVSYPLTSLKKKSKINPKKKEENHKICREINKLEAKTIEKINETKSWFFEKDNKISNL